MVGRLQEAAVHSEHHVRSDAYDVSPPLLQKYLEIIPCPAGGVEHHETQASAQVSGEFLRAFFSRFEKKNEEKGTAETIVGPGISARVSACIDRLGPLFSDSVRQKGIIPGCFFFYAVLTVGGSSPLQPVDPRKRRDRFLPLLPNLVILY